MMLKSAGLLALASAYRIDGRNGKVAWEGYGRNHWTSDALSTEEKRKEFEAIIAALKRGEIFRNKRRLLINPDFTQNA